MTLSCMAFSKRSELWRRRWQSFRHPINPEKQRLLRARWDSLPAELQTPNQISGRHLTHCGFTTGASYCSFHCTHCYLPKIANQIPIPSFTQMKEQIDANRRFQGPGAGLQITGGDVADAYWRSNRQSELVAIVRYAVDSGLVPMLMTHGQTLLDHPEFLEQLVLDGGLRQMAVHIDMTQAGRAAHPINRVTSEADLHPLREAFTSLALRVRARTGLPFELAHNCTVTERNIGSIAQVVRWFLTDPERSRIWRILSFQPEANTGRTIFSEHPVTPELVWREICRGIGIPINGSAYIGGHPDCNQGASLLISERSNHLLPLLPTDTKTRKLFTEILEKLGALSTMTTDGDAQSGSLLAYRVAGAFAKYPGLAWRIFLRIGWLLISGSIPWEFARALGTGRAHTINIGTHNFMHASQVANAPNDPVVQSRLDACVFKGAVKNRANGKWEAIPMCAMNQSRWSELYVERLTEMTQLPEVCKPFK
ncbi:MAG: radical SAM protein [Chthoniobacterales bacterium]|nr:radical SAM protein [Chthoniobacterales bacterium]